MSKTSAPNVRRMAQAAMIAALYVVLTMLATMLGVAFPAFQLRFSEALTLLPAFTSAAVPGLTLGCLISNIIASPYGVIDWVVGTLATFLAAVLTRKLRHVTFKRIPYLAPVPPVVINAVCIGALLAFTSPGGASFPLFWTSALGVGAGQAAACVLLGLPLMIALQKTGVLGRWFECD